MNIGCHATGWKFPTFVEFKSNHFATTKKYFENVPPKSWTPIFYFGCCCEDEMIITLSSEVMMMIKTSKFPGKVFVEFKSNHFATMFFLFKNVPPKSWTPIFYFGCCCEERDND
jgi:hypothetical protein